MNGEFSRLTALDRLRLALETLPGILGRFTEAEAGQRPSPERWSKKEVLGHLIDSASNNHQRFVRAQLAGRLEFPGYEQEAWVRGQHYQEAAWPDLIELWRALNTHLLHVVAHLSAEGQQATCRVGDRPEVTLAVLFEDYVTHLEHHLRKLVGVWPPH